MSTTSTNERYKLVFFVPPQYLASVKSAIFATGAGKYPKYSECCFTTPGIGSFRPDADANPTIGTPGQLEEVGEVRCEILCTGREQTKEAVAALKKYATRLCGTYQWWGLT